MSEGKTPPQQATGKPAVRIDEALAAWPSVQRTDAEWNDAAERVVSRVASGQPSGGSSSVRPSDEDLVRAPVESTLSPAIGEAHGSAAVEPRTDAETTHVSSRQRDRASLQDLAKLAAGPASSKAPSSGAFFGTPLPKPVSPADGDPDNSGMIDFAALAAVPAAKVDVSKAPEPARRDAAALDAEAVSTMRSIGPSKAQPATAPESGGRKPKSRWVGLGAAVAVAAVVAGVFFGMHGARRAEPAGAANATAPPTDPSFVAMTAQSPPAAGQAPPADRGVDPSTRPEIAQAPALHAGPGSTARPIAGAAGRATASKAATGPVSSPKAALAATPSDPASAGQSLQSLMQQAAGASPIASTPPIPTTTGESAVSTPVTGSVPLKPPQGAIQGALGVVLPGARACLGPDDAIAHATVTFKSDGSVQSVAVSGNAAGKPAEACIRSALTRAHVAPFAQPTFTAPATVRPN